MPDIYKGLYRLSSKAYEDEHSNPHSSSSAHINRTSSYPQSKQVYLSSLVRGGIYRIEFYLHEYMWKTYGGFNFPIGVLVFNTSLEADDSLFSCNDNTCSPYESCLTCSEDCGRCIPDYIPSDPSILANVTYYKQKLLQNPQFPTLPSTLVTFKADIYKYPPDETFGCTPDSYRGYYTIGMTATMEDDTQKRAGLGRITKDEDYPQVKFIRYDFTSNRFYRANFSLGEAIWGSCEALEYDITPLEFETPDCSYMGCTW